MPALDAYLNDGAAIARESRRIVEAEADLSGLAPSLRPLAVRQSSRRGARDGNARPRSH